MSKTITYMVQQILDLDKIIERTWIHIYISTHIPTYTFIQTHIHAHILHTYMNAYMPRHTTIFTGESWRRRRNYKSTLVARGANTQLNPSCVSAPIKCACKLYAFAMTEIRI